MAPRRLLFPVMAGLLSLASFLPAQISRDKIHSRPEIPSKEALGRLNLRLAWRAYVPTDGKRDALVRVEVIEKDLFVVTRSGTILRMDAETGRVHWRTTAGKPYTMLPYVTANNRSVYVVANAKLVSFDRATGRKKWDFGVSGLISAAPAVDDEQIYVSRSDTRLRAFLLPFVTEEAVASPGEVSRRSAIYGGDFEDRGPQPRPTWTDRTNIELSFKPLQTADTVFVIGPSGRAMAFDKIPREGSTTVERYALSTDGKIRVPPTSFGETAYVGSDDAMLYAINMTNGKLRWRHTAGSPVTRSPATTSKDVYVTSDREGLARIDRESGDSMWRIPVGRTFTDANAQADRFLAANNRFVYASDASGRLLVLDHKRGVRLSVLDTRDFRFPVVNQVTDRLYLAANDGLIVCLHDRDLAQPIRHQKLLEDANSPVLKLLEAPVEEVAGKEIPFRQAVADIRTKYKIKIRIAVPAFLAAKLDDPSEKKVVPPRSDKKTLRDHIDRLVKQVGATTLIEDQVILIVPAKAAPKVAPPPPKDAPPPKVPPEKEE